MKNTGGSEKLIDCNDEIKYYLLESSKWSKFLAIIGYVVMGFLILLGFLMMLRLPLLSVLSKGGSMFGLGLLYILIAVIYYFPTTYLYRFSYKIKQGVHSNDESVFTDGFLNLKKMFKFKGIMMIVVLSLYALISVIAIPIVLYLKAS